MPNVNSAPPPTEFLVQTLETNAPASSPASQSAQSLTPQFSLNSETIYKLIDHSVGAIALECGYHTAHQSSLDILNDVCYDYLRKIATLLRIAHDTEDWRDNESDFVDSLERVFHQIHVPSVANLHQFINQVRAIKRHRNISQSNQ